MANFTISVPRRLNQNKERTKMQKLLQGLQGKKTYFVAGLILIHAGSGWLLGKEVNWLEVLNGAGLMTIRAAVAKVTPGGGGGAALNLLVAGLAVFWVTGCTTMVNSDKIVTIKQRVLGIVIGENATTQMPEIKFGQVSTVFHMVPTATNEIYAPRYADTYEMTTAGNPFRVDINEDAAFGDVMITTNGTRAIRATQYRNPPAPKAAGNGTAGTNGTNAAPPLGPTVTNYVPVIVGTNAPTRTPSPTPEAENRKLKAES